MHEIPPKRPIRVAILGTQGIPAKYGGFETFAEELATRWALDPGFEITVVCPGPRREDQPASLGPVNLVYLPEPRLGPLTPILFDVRCLWTLRKSFDILYMLGYGAAFACWLPRCWGTRVWINMDGLEWLRSKWGPLTRLYVRIMAWVSTHAATRLIGDAQAVRTYFLETYGPKTRMDFIPYGANAIDPGDHPAEVLPAGLKAQGYFLVVARLEPENQVKEILDGYLQGETPEPLVIVGGISNPNAYVRGLLAAGGERVLFLGGIYDKALLAALRCHAKAYFHGHSVGGTNPSLLEALAAGRPIIAHDNPFNREVAVGVATYFKSPQDVRTILGEGTYLTPPPGGLVPACQKQLQEHYTWDRITMLYKDLAERELLPSRGQGIS